MSAGQSSGIELQPRDFALLRGLFESRVLTLGHVTALYFDGKQEMAKKRVQKLKAAGAIRERPRRLSDPSVLHLTWKGYISLRDNGHVDDDSRLSPKIFTRRMRVSALTLAHEIAIGDVMTACTTALRESVRFEMLEFSVWPRRYSFTVDREYRTVPVQPDGYVRLLEKNAEDESELHFFLEVDKGTETIERLAEKCVNYREYHRSGGYAEFCGEKRQDRKSRPFRVLVICKSEQRGDNLAERLLQFHPPFSTMILITTFGECLRYPLGDIWMTPAAFKNTVTVADNSGDLGGKIQPRLCPIYA
jgi:hypothetical protein